MALKVWPSENIEQCDGRGCKESGAGVILSTSQNFLEFCWDCWPKIVAKVADAKAAQEQEKTK